jgi:hypothetical protein
MLGEGFGPMGNRTWMEDKRMKTNWESAFNEAFKVIPSPWRDAGIRMDRLKQQIIDRNTGPEINFVGIVKIQSVSDIVSLWDNGLITKAEALKILGLKEE